jgi:3-hydroxybutyrate dehydrogenase
MSGPLSGRSAVITGSTSGIGRAIAERFALEGANVMLNGFGDPTAIESQRADMERLGVKVAHHGADMMKPGEVTDLVVQAGKLFGAVDILVNNAGIQHVAPVDEFPVEKWDQILAINLSAAFHATRAALPGMKARKWGRVINMASIHGLVASPFKSAYIAAKHGIVGFTKTVALEVAEMGITANAICPGYALTPIVENQIEDQSKVHGIPREEVVRQVILANQPTKQFIRVEDLASLALYLASDASAGITGTAIPVDGGWTAR